jgi:hypothetical protein
MGDRETRRWETGRQGDGRLGDMEMGNGKTRRQGDKEMGDSEHEQTWISNPKENKFHKKNASFPGRFFVLDREWFNTS